MALAGEEASMRALEAKCGNPHSSGRSDIRRNALYVAAANVTDRLGNTALVASIMTQHTECARAALIPASDARTRQPKTTIDLMTLAPLARTAPFIPLWLVTAARTSPPTASPSQLSALYQRTLTGSSFNSQSLLPTPLNRAPSHTEPPASVSLVVPPRVLPSLSLRSPRLLPWFRMFPLVN